MSVVINDGDDKESNTVIVKGSPEKIRDLCLQETLPDNFNEVLNSFTFEGLRVIAFGTKKIKSQDFEIRKELENGLVF